MWIGHCRMTAWLVAAVLWLPAAAGTGGNGTTVSGPALAASEPKDWTGGSSAFVLSPEEAGKLSRISSFEHNSMTGMTLPQYWKFNVSHYVTAATFPLSSKVTTVGNETFWQVKTRGLAVFFSPSQRLPGWHQYRLVITARGSGSIIPFLYGSSTALAPTLEGKKITPGRDFQSWVAEMDDAGTNQLDYSRTPALGFSGSVTVKSIEITACPVAGALTVDGEILASSPLPKISSADYPDCNYTLKFRVNRVISGEGTSRIIQLVVPGFVAGKRTVYADLRPGAKYKLQLVPYDNLPEKLRSNKLFDTLQEYDLDQYYLLNARKLDVLPQGDMVFKDGIAYVSRFQAGKPLNPPLPEAAVAARTRRMHDDMAMLDARLAAVGDTERQNAEFKNIWKKNQPKYQRLGMTFSSLTRSYVDLKHLFWGQSGEGFFALPENHQVIREGGISDKNLAALKSLNEYLALNNIQLIMVVQPDYYDLAAQMLNPEWKIPVEVNSARMTRQLLAAGIEAVYPFDEIRKNAGKYEFSFMYPDNDHPSWGVQDAVAELLSGRLQRFPEKSLGKKIPPSAFSCEVKPGWGGTAIRYPANVKSGNHKPDTPVSSRIYSIHGKNLFSDSASPILVIGNSHIQSPMPQGSLSVAIARKTGILPQNYYVGGNGPVFIIPSNLLLRQEEYLRGKKVCIYFFDSFIASGNLLNLREYDRLRVEMSGRHIVAELLPVRKESHPFQPSDSFEDRLWELFLQQNGGTETFFYSEHPQTLYDGAVPAKKDPNGKVYLHLHLAQYPGYRLVLLINGVKHDFGIVTRPLWRDEFLTFTPVGGRLVIALPPGVKGRAALALSKVRLLE